MGGSKHLFNLLLLIAAVLLLYFGYRFLAKPGPSPVGDSATLGLASAGFSTGDASRAVSDEFLDTLTGLQGLDLRGAVFANPVFQDLQDTNTLLPDETPGRPNPFAPINFAAPRFSADLIAGSTTLNSASGTGGVLDRLRTR